MLLGYVLLFAVMELLPVLLKSVKTIIQIILTDALIIALLRLVLYVLDCLVNVLILLGSAFHSIIKSVPARV